MSEGIQDADKLVLVINNPVCPSIYGYFMALSTSVEKVCFLLEFLEFLNSGASPSVLVN